MAKHNVGDWVWIPAERLSGSETSLHALVRAKVEGQDQRSVVVSHDGQSHKVASRLVHTDDLGITVLVIGDGASEVYLLHPLATSIMRYLRLLLPDDRLHHINLRTISEFGLLLPKQARSNFLIIVGHAGPRGYRFLDREEPVDGATLAATLSANTSLTTVVSLGCESGKAGFARPLSLGLGTIPLLAPLQPLHGAEASVFTQTFLLKRLLAGLETKAAWRDADWSLSTRMKLWKSGEMIST